MPHDLPADPITFSDLVRRCRDDLGLTQAEFAERHGGVVQQTVGRWERGETRTQPRAETIARLADLCGVGPGTLLATTYADTPPDAGARIDPRAGATRDLRALLDAAARLTPRQVRALLAVAREMHHD